MKIEISADCLIYDGINIPSFTLSPIGPARVCRYQSAHPPTDELLDHQVDNHSSKRGPFQARDQAENLQSADDDVEKFHFHCHETKSQVSNSREGCHRSTSSFCFVSFFPLQVDGSTKLACRYIYDYASNLPSNFCINCGRARFVRELFSVVSWPRRRSSSAVRTRHANWGLQRYTFFLSLLQQVRDVCWALILINDSRLLGVHAADFDDATPCRACPVISLFLGADRVEIRVVHTIILVVWATLHCIATNYLCG